MGRVLYIPIKRPVFERIRLDFHENRTRGRPFHILFRILFRVLFRPAAGVAGTRRTECLGQAGERNRGEQNRGAERWNGTGGDRTESPVAGTE